MPTRRTFLAGLAAVPLSACAASRPMVLPDILADGGSATGPGRYVFSCYLARDGGPWEYVERAIEIEGDPWQRSELWLLREATKSDPPFCLAHMHYPFLVPA